MRKLDVLMSSLALGVLYLAVSWPVRSDKAQDFLTSLEEAVKAIAESATRNYDNSCGLVDTCQSQQNCSRRECFLMQGQGHDYTCTHANNYSICNSHANSQCNRVGADFSRSMVRLPGNETVTLPDTGAETVKRVFGTTICTQRPLDATFKEQRFSYSNDSLFYNLFFAAADGAFRFYPAREILSGNCNTYDPRIRGWYNSAISVKKNVVMLLDTGSAMAGDTQFFSTSIHPLDTVKNLLTNLGQTLTLGDTFTLISINSSGPYLLNAPFSVTDSASETDEFFIKLRGNPALNGPQSDDIVPSSFKDGFARADATSPSPNVTRDALKIILLFTDSSNGNVPPADIANSTLTPLKSKGVGLFVFDLAPGGASSLWDAALCSAQASFSGAQQNPLLLLNPYFSFLARARIEANNGSATVFYTKPYYSASDLGRVIAVSYLAMSSDNTVLVGVAGLAVQTAGLPPDLEYALEIALESDSYKNYTTIPTISTFLDPITTCSVEYQKNCSGAQNGNLQPVCYSSDKPTSDDKLQRLLCCDGEGCSAGHHHSSLVWVVALVTIGVTLLAVLAAIFLTMRKFKAKRRWVHEYALSAPLISYEELSSATNNFDEQKIIGKGSFGVVYRGRLGDMEVAVKKLSRIPDKTKCFQDEITVNMRITEHPNLVKLYGACVQDADGGCYLVYKFIVGGDLHSWLWPERNPLYQATELGPVIFLTWNRRERIAKGIAQGLDHLHRGLPIGQVYHLDLKPRNILLDRDFTPKIADFGISQLYEPGRTHEIGAITGGSFGYMAPEVIQGQLLPNSKMDVFSFGVVLLQLVSGRSVHDLEVKPYFYIWARQLAEMDAMDELIDGYLLESVQLESRENLIENCRRVVDIALQCTEDDPNMRPEIVDIMGDLACLLDVLELELPSSEDD